jgi:hypothetical protein
VLPILNFLIPLKQFDLEVSTNIRPEHVLYLQTKQRRVFSGKCTTQLKVFIKNLKKSQILLLVYFIYI